MKGSSYDNRTDMTRYQNKQRYEECRLVSLWNAARYFGIEVPEFGSKQYEDACEKACCIVGACIDISEEEERLGLRRVRGKRSLHWIRRNLPVELGIHHPRKGFHSVLVVEVKRGRVLLTNYASNRVFWLRWNTVNRMIPGRPNNKIYGYEKAGES